MHFDLQPALENDLIKIQPLAPTDFEALYAIAGDPLLWEQHPNKDRYKREVFQNFFKGAIESGGAFLVMDKKTGEVIGSSRYYDAQEPNTIDIGYTFIARSHWGKGYNKALKALMIDHAFKFVDKVIFHVGAGNIRSQKAVGNIGGKKIGEVEMEYYGEPNRLNFVYQINKAGWQDKARSMQRPAQDEYDPYFRRYIDLVAGDDFSRLLEQNTAEVIQLFSSIPPGKHEYAYAEGKWTVKQLLLHITDTERVFTYRAFVGARGDNQTLLQSFDDNLYAVNAQANSRSMESLLHEFKAVRSTARILFEHLNESQSKFRANAGKYAITPRALGYIMIGHVQHHLAVLRERYL